MKYTGIGAEMVGACVFGGFAGQWLDNDILDLNFPVFTIVITLLGLTGTFIHLIRQLESDRKAEEQSNS